MNTRVLLIESEPWLGDHYQQVLERDKAVVNRAANAYSAMDSIDDELPDVIIMNLNLSGASSVALLHELQTYSDTGQIPIIVYSTAADITSDDLRPYGVQRLLNSMTMEPNDLVAAVRSVTV